MDFKLIRRAVQFGWSDNELEKLSELMSEPHNPTLPEISVLGNDKPDLAPQTNIPDDLLTIAEAAAKFNYTDAAINWWFTNHPEIVNRYVLDGRVLVSEAECRAYIKKHGAKREEPPYIPRPRSPRVPLELTDWDSVTGASKVTGLSVAMIRELMKNNRIAVHQVDERFLLVNSRQIAMLDKQPKYYPTEDVFKEWKPINLALEQLGLEYAEYNREVSKYCEQGRLASHKIGNFRFINLKELEQWFLERQA